MSDDIVHPIGGGGNKPSPVKWWEWQPKLSDPVACYGADQNMIRFWKGQQASIYKIHHFDMVTVKFLPPVAADIIEAIFHRKQLRPLKQTGGRTVWIRKEDIDKVSSDSMQVFQVYASFQRRSEPEWVECEQKTVEWIEYE